MPDKEGKKQPGVMIYFEVQNCLKRMDYEAKGRLFEAILEYAQYRIPPNFSEEDDLTLLVVWDMIRPKIDADAERYRDVCEKNPKKAIKRWEEARENK